MKETAKDNLLQLKSLLEILDEAEYNMKHNILSGATVGQHMRHILEFYLLLVSGSFEGTISYDKRERNQKIESSLSFAVDTINLLIPALSLLKEKDPVELEADYTEDGSSGNIVQSSIGRELAYCIEHSIHHQALIKAGLIAAGLAHTVDINFGVAYSTIRYREE
jgi:uncharacterized damage-inducible protein DinB